MKKLKFLYVYQVPQDTCNSCKKIFQAFHTFVILVNQEEREVKNGASKHFEKKVGLHFMERPFCIVQENVGNVSSISV